MNKSGKIVKIVLMSLLAMCLTAIMVCTIVFDNFNLGFFSINLGTYDEIGYSVSENITELDPEKISNINIDWVSGEIEVSKSADGKMRISESARNGESIDYDERMRYQVSGDTLTVKFQKSGFHIGFYNYPSKKLIVELPDKLYEKISVDTTSAEFKMSDINSKVIDIDSVSGTSTLTGCETTDAKMKSVSGEINFSGKVENVNYKTVSGEAEIRSECAIKTLTGKTVSGKSVIALPEETDFTIDFDSTSGDFNSDFSVHSNGDIHTKGSGEYKYSVNSVSGDLTVRSCS